MFSSIVLVPLVVFGIGLVIFVHEAGHYLAARWCGARVEVFSLGFGPRLFGWRRGDTLFQVAAVPLGGYVKVAGEYFDGTSPKEPGTLSSLSVPQRFFYYSGGVIMNVLFAFVVMPLVMFAGLPARQPIIGAPNPGMPAWEAGVPRGSRVVRVNDDEIVDFERLYAAVALNGKAPLTLHVQPPGSDEVVAYELTPKFHEELGLYQVGLPPAPDPEHKIDVRPDSAAAKAGLVDGERLQGVVGMSPDVPVQDQLILAISAGGPLTVVVANDAGESREVTIDPKWVESDDKLIGVASASNLVRGTRSTGRCSSLLAQLDLREGDVVHRVGNVRVVRTEDIHRALGDLPHDAQRLDLLVERDGEFLVASARLAPSIPVAVLAEDIHFEGRDASTVVAAIARGAAREGGLQDGDRIVSVNGDLVEDWDALLTRIRAAIARNFSIELLAYRDPIPTIDATGALVAVAAGAGVEEVRLTVDPRRDDRPEYGVSLVSATMIRKADTLGEAISIGAYETKRFLVDVWQQLQKMLFSDEISTKNLGGIISISVLSYDTASQGLPKLFFFLAILSINLAILNVLPIPILDGGHLMFLLIEGIKGSPVSERTFGYSQVVGLVMIMSLMVYVTYQDIVRWILKT